jgi:N-acetylmuramic acid 6-phosphate etherase
MANWAALLTEQRNPASAHIDEVSTQEMLAIINGEDARVAPAVERELPLIAQAVDLINSALTSGGRLFYLGAGTSGRLGVLDAAECPPTFGTDPNLVQGLIAGGPEAVFQAVEGIEDSGKTGAQDLRDRNLSTRDVVVGIAASGVTPYVLGGLQYARDKSSATILLTCNPNAARDVAVDVVVGPEVGPEVITGSTRMKAGIATKMVLNMFSTGAMIKQGKTFGNLMVDLQPKNDKLRDRSMRILAELGQLSANKASQLLEKAAGNLKLALVMVLAQIEREEAVELLEKHHGRVKNAVFSRAAKR